MSVTNRITHSIILRVMFVVVAILVFSASYEEYCVQEVSDLVEAIQEVAFDDGESVDDHALGLEVFRPHYYSEQSFFRVSKFEVMWALVFECEGVIYAKCDFVDQMSDGRLVESTSWLTIPISKRNGCWFVPGRIYGLA